MHCETPNSDNSIYNLVDYKLIVNQKISPSKNVEEDIQLSSGIRNLKLNLDDKELG